MLPFRCKNDPVVKFLKEKVGADIVRIPDESIQPLCVLAGSANQAIYLGELRDCLVNPAPKLQKQAPKISRLPDISGMRTNKVGLGLGLNILSGLLQGFGLASPGIQAHFQGASTISFSFDNVQRREIRPMFIGQQLAGAQIATNPVTSIFFGTPGTSSPAFLVVDSVIVINAFSVYLDGGANKGFNISISAIHQAVASANANVQVANDETDKVSFTGTKELTFAFTSLKFTLDNKGGILSIRPPRRSYVIGRSSPRSYVKGPAGVKGVAGAGGNSGLRKVAILRPPHYEVSRNKWSMIEIVHPA